MKKIKAVGKKKKADGKAGERWASALLGIAACAETAHGTSAEDDRKVDLKLSFEHAFHAKDPLDVRVQVKSGASYVHTSSTDGVLTLKINEPTRAALSSTTGLGLLVWVPPKPGYRLYPGDRLYWYASDPGATPETQFGVPPDKYVRPSIRYDLTRRCVYASWPKSFPRQTMPEIAESLVQGRARKAYGALKKKARKRPCYHPLAGKLAVTRLAWRHVTRRSRSGSQRILSLRVAPYIKHFLDKVPSRYYPHQLPLDRFGPRTVETRNLVCQYDGALSLAGETYSLYLCIREEISYPTKWCKHPLGVGDVQQKATLAGWWCVKKK